MFLIGSGQSVSTSGNQSCASHTTHDSAFHPRSWLLVVVWRFNMVTVVNRSQVNSSQCVPQCVSGAFTPALGAVHLGSDTLRCILPPGVSRLLQQSNMLMSILIFRAVHRVKIRDRTDPSETVGPLVYSLRTLPLSRTVLTLKESWNGNTEWVKTHAEPLPSPLPPHFTTLCSHKINI